MIATLGRRPTRSLMKHVFKTLVAALTALTLASAGSARNWAKDPTKLGAEIVNGLHPELKGSGLAGGDGLTKLGGAKIELINADHQGNPQVRQRQTLRLIQQEKVA